MIDIDFHDVRTVKATFEEKDVGKSVAKGQISISNIEESFKVLSKTDESVTVMSVVEYLVKAIRVNDEGTVEDSNDVFFSLSIKCGVNATLKPKDKTIAVSSRLHDIESKNDDELRQIIKTHGYLVARTVARSLISSTKYSTVTLA